MVNYETGKIYKVVNDINGMTYYGSTTQTLSRRMVGHRGDYKRRHNKTYELWGDIEDCKIYLIELCPCDLKIELLRRERYYIENNDCINKTIPSRTNKEYNEDNKDELILKRNEYYKANKQKYKDYQNNNKEKISLQKKEKYQANKEQYKDYREKNKDKILLKEKEYREKNKEKISLKAKEYREKNKDKILLKAKE